MMATITVPRAASDAARSWFKTITGVDLGRDWGFAVCGAFLEPGATYSVPSSGLLLGVDRDTAVGNRVTVWQISDGGLRQVRQIVRKGPWSGKATIRALAKLLRETPWGGGEPVEIRPPANDKAGDCRRCHLHVPAGEGIQFRTRSGWWAVAHQVCPPKPNRYAGYCWRCRGWLDAGEGEWYAWHSLFGRHMIQHGGLCPPARLRKQPPEAANVWEGRCHLCRRMVPARQGLYVRVRFAFNMRTVGYVRHLPGWCPGPGGMPRRIGPRPLRGRRPSAGPTTLGPGNRSDQRRSVRVRRSASVTAVVR